MPYGSGIDLLGIDTGSQSPAGFAAGAGGGLIGIEELHHIEEDVLPSFSLIIKPRFIA